ncbi:site-specific integrase [Achromobacter spanius]|uniref:tyrosine-type recombinase/integrase n=1 Tax=Achromobacter spanius TaxID=217203 RepID=UPI000F8F881C|nr:site-specific integrase [Achromobacter spanius]AZS77624.1 site-specific integrase [Achromobacter spanius]
MRGAINKLSDTKIEAKLKEARKAIEQGLGRPILLGDGGGLTLQITTSGTSSWLYRYMRNRKAIAIGLGKYPDVSLRLARERASEQRQLRAEGLDPADQKLAKTAEKKAAASSVKTFDDCAAQYIADHRAEWKSTKHAQQWRNTLATYASPHIGTKAISAITTVDIKLVLAPIWNIKHETATRLQGRVAAVLDWATAHGLRQGDNPARWKGHLEHLLAKSTESSRAQKHHAALPYSEIPEFLRRLQAQDGSARWALEFLILTAGRTSEVTGAHVREIDLERGMWTVPKERMKAGKEHRVPLTPRALTIVESRLPLANGGFLFPGGRMDKPLSNMAMSMLLRRMSYDAITVHGFRSTFRDFAAEMTTHDFSTAEAALAHTMRDKVAAAYARTDLYDKRAALMSEWEQYCYRSASPAQLVNE